MPVAIDDPVRRDYVNGERFAQVLGERGIGRDTTVIIYGDKSNWWAATFKGRHDKVRSYDGSWTEWDNAVGVPVEVGTR